MSKTKLTVIGVGTAGISITASVAKYMKDKVSDPYSEMEYHVLDTTKNTIAGFPELDKNFTLLTNGKHNGRWEGRGGERKDMDAYIALGEAVKIFLDDKGFVNNKQNFYNIVYTLSGATGSSAGEQLVSLMLEAGYNVTVTIVSDTTSLLKCKTANTALRNLHKAAIKQKTTLGVSYFSNKAEAGESAATTLDRINGFIHTTFETLSIFMSGNILHVDRQDVINFFNPSNYKTFKVPAGIYNINVRTGDLTEVQAMLSITATKRDSAQTYPMGALSSKSGYMPDGVSDDLLSIDTISLCMMEDYIYDVMNNLKEIENSLENNVATTSRVIENDDDAMVSDDGFEL